MRMTTNVCIVSMAVLGIAACDRSGEDRAEAPEMREHHAGAEMREGPSAMEKRTSDPAETRTEPAPGTAEPMTGTEAQPPFERGEGPTGPPGTETGEDLTGERPTRPQGQPAAETAGAADIVATARGSGQFDQLVSALEAAGLVEMLQTEGPFTVFAPTDEAFDELSEATVDELMQEANRERLREVLEHHIVRGDMNVSALVAEGPVSTRAGGSLSVETVGNDVRVDGIPIVQPDIQCANGVIHGIDAVMFPDE